MPSTVGRDAGTHLGRKGVSESEVGKEVGRRKGGKVGRMKRRRGGREDKEEREGGERRKGGRARKGRWERESEGRDGRVREVVGPNLACDSRSPVYSDWLNFIWIGL